MYDSLETRISSVETVFYFLSSSPNIPHENQASEPK